MHRLSKPEILDVCNPPGESVSQAYRQLTRIHRFLGDTAAIISALRRDPLPVQRVLDVGCANGGVLADVRRSLGVKAIGVDIRPPVHPAAGFPIVVADAVRDTLPAADVAYSMYLGHHLAEEPLMQLIRNVRRSCRRFLLLDLVRHRLPLALFRTFLGPFVSPLIQIDGVTSIRRSYTPSELRRLVREALAGTGANFRQTVAPCYIRQIVDITYS